MCARLLSEIIHDGSITDHMFVTHIYWLESTSTKSTTTAKLCIALKNKAQNKQKREQCIYNTHTDTNT